MISSQKLWPLGHEAGQYDNIVWRICCLSIHLYVEEGAMYLNANIYGKSSDILKIFTARELIRYENSSYEL
jgi:hypothetical protein